MSLLTSQAVAAADQLYQQRTNPAYQASNLTFREAYRLHGVLPEARMLELIEIAETAPEVGKLAAYAEEAATCFPSEDFLDSVLDMVHVGKQAALYRAIEAVRDETRQSAEYGQDELRKLLKEIE
jgi:hypothetical protein